MSMGRLSHGGGVGDYLTMSGARRTPVLGDYLTLKGGGSQGTGAPMKSGGKYGLGGLGALGGPGAAIALGGTGAIIAIGSMIGGGIWGWKVAKKKKVRPGMARFLCTLGGVYVVGFFGGLIGNVLLLGAGVAADA